MLEQSVIEPNASPWIHLYVWYPRKQTGESMFCVDHRALNSITKLDAFPLQLKPV